MSPKPQYLALAIRTPCLVFTALYLVLGLFCAASEVLYGIVIVHLVIWVVFLLFERSMDLTRISEATIAP